MEVIYGLIPGMIFMGVIAVGILFWAARNGQYDDMEGDAQRILMDDDLEPESDSNQPEQHSTEATPAHSAEATSTDTVTRTQPAAEAPARD